MWFAVCYHNKHDNFFHLKRKLEGFITFLTDTFPTSSVWRKQILNFCLTSGGMKNSVNVKF